MAARPGGSGFTGRHFTASGAVTSAPGSVSIILISQGSTAGTAILRDGGAAGAVLFRANTIAGGAPIPASLLSGLDFDTDIFVELSGTGTAASVVYSA